ncbi:hypothetical protein AVEN_186376-1 [Araneus ventricosus]|uniref:Uncharacterized protein n=1 Tax=Araneus ventricosus TaxID=182803 RepID=A0A4Y2SU65_ARAVE|nr:hypothetical protein AVEN_186376-1 [Araneus ventricosus]
MTQFREILRHPTLNPPPKRFHIKKTLRIYMSPASFWRRVLHAYTPRVARATPPKSVETRLSANTTRNSSAALIISPHSERSPRNTIINLFHRGNDH